MAANSQPTRSPLDVKRIQVLVKTALPPKTQQQPHTGSEYAVPKQHCLIWIMPRTKELSEDLWSRIVGMHDPDKGSKSILSAGRTEISGTC